MTNPTADNIRGNVVDAMSARGLSTRAFAGLLGKSPSWAARRLAGPNPIEFRPSELTEIARVLNTTPVSLMPTADAAVA